MKTLYKCSSARPKKRRLFKITFGIFLETETELKSNLEFGSEIGFKPQTSELRSFEFNPFATMENNDCNNRFKRDAHLVIDFKN
jgi:hypothetical protein